MQKLFTGIKDELAQFIRQRNDVALVIQCRADEGIPLVKLLEELEDQASAEMFWICTDPFNDAVSYADAVVNTFAAKHGAVTLALQKNGMEPWPSLPPMLLDERVPPVQRLRDTVAFSRELFPDPDGFLAVWAFMPTAVANPQAYADLWAQVLWHEFPHPWCHHLRFLVWCEPADPMLPAALGAIPHVKWYSPDLSQAALQQALEEEASDAAVPLEWRLQHVFSLASMDYAQQRFDDALVKYSVLLKFYTRTRNPTMTALVLNGIGEVHQRRGSLQQAAHCFEAALTPAAGAPGPPIPVLLNITLNLGNLWMNAGQWAVAEGYYDAAQQFATLQRAADTKLRALDNLGVCQYMQGKVPAALGAWHAGSTAAGELEMPELKIRMLQRLQAHYHAVGDHAQQAAVEQQIAACGSTASRG